jgi:hypothetical protein
MSKSSGSTPSAVISTSAVTRWRFPFDLASRPVADHHDLVILGEQSVERDGELRILEIVRQRDGDLAHGILLRQSMEQRVCRSSSVCGWHA